MELGTFQTLCLAVLALAYAIFIWSGDSKPRRLLEVITLVLAAWLAEDTCVAAYRFYYYADDWWLKIGRVPILIPLIWPMVILSARSLVSALWPQLEGFRHALAVGCIVSFDASLIEIVSVEAGYWSWFEGGYVGVPLMGIVGWGLFAAIASWWMESDRRLGWTPLVAVLITHAALVACWWGLLRWVLREDLGSWALLGFGLLALSFCVAVLRVRPQRRMSRADAITRLLATSLFVGLLVSLDGPNVTLLWLHLGLTALPYLCALPDLRRASGDA